MTRLLPLVNHEKEERSFVGRVLWAHTFVCAKIYGVTKVLSGGELGENMAFFSKILKCPFQAIQYFGEYFLSLF